MNKIANIKQVAKELHKPARKNYETRKVIVYNVDEISGFNFILKCLTDSVS